MADVSQCLCDSFLSYDASFCWCLFCTLLLIMINRTIFQDAAANKIIFDIQFVAAQNLK